MSIGSDVNILKKFIPTNLWMIFYEIFFKKIADNYDQTQIYFSRNKTLKNIDIRTNML